MDSINEFIDLFEKIRDTSDKAIKAHENENMEDFEYALGRFALLMMELKSFKV